MAGARRGAARLDFRIRRLGAARHPSSLPLSTRSGDLVANYTSDNERVLYDVRGAACAGCRRAGRAPAALEAAGPRKRIFFAPGRAAAAIVTCGGLCPGINDVIRALVMELHYRYGCRRILGVRHGFAGFIPGAAPPPEALTPQRALQIHREGGSILGSSRGPQSPAAIVDALRRWRVNLLFAIGGDGTLKGALAIEREAARRKLELAVVAIPKTIDNDIPYTERTFGFDTACAVAVQAVAAAHVEATGAPNGVGLVKLMGRESGFVAAHAVLADNDVNLALVPEVPFRLEGPRGVFAWVESRLRRRGHIVIVAAEGAGQDLLEKSGGRDASGNARLGDIGAFLRERIREHCAERGLAANLKYIDPSYLIRAAPANPADSIFCLQLAQAAVHAAFAGRTGLMVGLWHNRLVHVPLTLAAAGRKRIEPDGELWRNVVEATGQPPRMG